MKRTIFLGFGLIFAVLLYGQSTTEPNNNGVEKEGRRASIRGSWVEEALNPSLLTIHGNVYYFRPSTTPSSPPPTQSSDFLGSGHWYGEDAARAWASIADWVFDYCLITSPAVTGDGNERVYISAVHVVRRGDRDFENYASRSWWTTGEDFSRSNKQVRIDYWVVRNGAQMADGRRETRWFGF